MSGEFYYSVADEIFRKFPGYIRGVALAYGVKNGETPAELAGLLRQAEESIRQKLNLETLIENPRIAAWREAYRAFGAKPSEFRPSMEAMARRVLRSQEIPLINTLVDIGNLLSLRHLVPTGGHAIDQLEGNIELRLATGAETFMPFDSEELEHPLPGEVVFVEGNEVLTRRWTWRQSSRTLTLPTTTAIEFNIDGLPPATPGEVEQIGAEALEMIQKYCGGWGRLEILTADHPRIPLKE